MAGPARYVRHFEQHAAELLVPTQDRGQQRAPPAADAGDDATVAKRPLGKTGQAAPCAGAQRLRLLSVTAFGGLRTPLAEPPMALL